MKVLRLRASLCVQMCAVMWLALCSYDVRAQETREVRDSAVTPDRFLGSAAMVTLGLTPQGVRSVLAGKLWKQWPYAIAGLGIGWYVLEKSTDVSSSVWMSESHENLGEGAAPLSEDSSFGDMEGSSGPEDPKQVPIAPQADNAQNAQESSQKNVQEADAALAQFTSLKERLNMAVAVNMASLLPLVFSTISDLGDAKDVEKHKNYYQALLMSLMKLKDPFNLDSQALIKAVPEDVGSIYRSPHTIALVQTNSILARMRHVLEIDDEAFDKYVNTWNAASFEAITAYLSMKEGGEDTEYAAMYNMSIHMLILAVNMAAHLKRVVPLLDRIINPKKDVVYSKEHKEYRQKVIALAKVFKLGKLSLRNKDEKELQVLRAFYDQRVRNLQKPGVAAKDFSATEGSSSKEDENVVMKVDLLEGSGSDALNIGFFEKKSGSEQDVNFQNVIMLVETQHAIYRGTYRYLKRLAYLSESMLQSAQ